VARLMRAGVAAVVLLVVAGAAQAQDGRRGGEQRMFFGGGGGMGGAFGGAMITPRQLERHGALLGLSEEQIDSARVLVEGYQDAVRQQGERMRDKMREIRESGADFRDPEVRAEIRKAREEVRAARRKLDDELMNDLKSLLTREQEDRWPAFERAVRRDSSLRRGLMSGERVNLFDVVEGLRLDGGARQQIQGLLEDYDLDLDRALKERDAVHEESFGRAMELGFGGDPNELQKVMDRAREASQKVREVNKRYARQIADALPEAVRPEFERAFKSASFPQVYRPVLAERHIEAAERFEDLTESQRESLRALRESFERNLKSVNDRLASAQETVENTVTVGGLMLRFRGPDRDEPAEVAEARRQKRELNESTLQAIKKVLTPEQAARLPAEERERGRNDDGPGPRRRPVNDRT
jgi:Spy/CpxP family protein refolding chaperone